MDIEIVALLAVVAVVLLLTVTRMLGRKEKLPPLEERMERMLEGMASDLRGLMDGGDLYLERNGVRMKYEYKTGAGEEGANIHHVFTAETGGDLKRYNIIRPPSQKKQIEVYPKTEFSAYMPSKLRKLLEQDPDADELARERNRTSLSTGGNCISPRLGIYMGTRKAITVDISAELDRSNMLYSLFAGTLRQDEEKGCTENWKNFIVRGFSLLEKAVKIAGEG